MQVNDSISGFRILRARENTELRGTLWEMEHEATGAKLAWVDNGESNKLFSIAFKTLPWNDTGVFHILEHSVLNGSEKYPVKEPFVNLLKSSMNTFLNAMTFPDKTVYPVSSRNEQDFLNLTSVYLDAVFHPAIYENPNIFYQEGWHYELADASAAPAYNGVVFNEMKGAFSSPDTLLNQGIMTLLFPDTCYGYVSGGHPVHIPELTYEEFLDAHRRFYSPSNAWVYLDGAVPLDAVLAMLDGYFSGSAAGDRIPMPAQKTVPYREETQFYEAEDDGDALLIVGQRMGAWNDRKTLLALSVLCSYLTGTNESPLKKAILESGIAEDATLVVEDSIAQPFVALQVRQMDGARKEELLTLARDFLAQHAIRQEDLLATMDQLEFSLRDADEPKGLMRNISGLNTWLFGGDILEGMTFTPLFAALREALEGDYFQNLLNKITLSGENAAALLLQPSQQKGEEDRQAEAQRLQEASAKWTAEDRRAILAQNEKLAQWQAAPDSEEALRTLPALPIEEIGQQLSQIQTQAFQACGRPVLYHKTGNGDISHYGLYFSLADRGTEELQVLSFLTNLLGQLPTVSHSVSELELLTKSTLGNLDYNVSVYQDRQDSQLCKPYFAVTFSALPHKEAEALALVEEILLETCFEQEGLEAWIHIIASQGRESLYQNIVASGNRFASLRAASHLYAASALTDKTEGYGFYCWLKELDDTFDSRIASLTPSLSRLAKDVFCRSRVTVSVAAGQESRRIEAFLRSLPEGTNCGETLPYPTDGKLSKEAILIPAQVSYAAACGQCAADYSGSMDLLANIMNFDYLWSEIRVKGGAYGCGFRVSSGGSVSFTSYRDPSPLNSQKVFASAGDFLMAFCAEDASLHQYIIGAAASQEPLLPDREKAQHAMADYFMGICPQERNLWRKQLLTMTKADLLRCAQWLQSTQYAQCIVGSRDALDGATQWELFTL